MQLPLWNSLAPGRDAYVPKWVMHDLLREKGARRWWRTNGAVTSLQHRDGGIIKPLEAFPEHAADESAFGALMEHCYARGIVRPPSYADMFHQLYDTPRIRWSANAQFFGLFSGGWQEAKIRGVARGRWKVYDIRSAYLWSLSHGLPDPRTFRFSRAPQFGDVSGDCKPGLYVVELARPCNLPYPFNRHTRTLHLASTDEITTYDLPISRYHFGLTWSRTLSAAYMVDLIQSFPCAKNIARGFWGRWASHAATETVMANGKTWSMRNPALNVVWAHVIVSRVKMRIWREAMNAAHIFVDAIITQDDLPMGTQPGDWRFVAEYPDGIEILGPGIYGIPGGELAKHAGRVL